jgi:hypothetical protein
MSTFYGLFHDFSFFMYKFDSGRALTPCATTLNKTVIKTASMKVSCPGKEFSLSKVISARTMEASPLGPNHPIKSIEFQLTLVPRRDIATGNMRIIVKLKMAYKMICQVI